MKFQLSSVVALTAISSAAGVACGSLAVDDILDGGMIGFAEATVTLPPKTCTPEQQICIFGICTCTTAAQLTVSVDGLAGSPCSSMFEEWCDSDGCKAGVDTESTAEDGTVCCDTFGNNNGGSTCAGATGADLLVTREFGSRKECAEASSGDGGTSYNGDQGSVVYVSVRVEKKAGANVTTAGLMVDFSAGKLGEVEATCTELSTSTCANGAAAMAPSAVLVASLLLLGASQM